LGLTRWTVILVQKNYRWIWTAVNREGRRFLDFVIGTEAPKQEKSFGIKSKISKKKK